ncbi:C-C motif chemokine 3-like [Phyllostomus discolor]|uniref:C-C motif chemokine n=1 Tax=Phyllostomus discolor TaxID=89673 RepID=A0A6J2MHM4_9CHIR|nr:C-C motif chemokine 3-like [Phyllostomus discolor]
MKASLALLTFLLAVAALHSEANEGPTQDQVIRCCFSFISRRIPLRFVKHYYLTTSQCSVPGVVFLTKRGRQICANPSDAWVQKYIEQLELQ